MTFLLALTKTTTLLVDLFANSPDVLELIDGETLVDRLFEMNKVLLVNTRLLRYFLKKILKACN